MSLKRRAAPRVAVCRITREAAVSDGEAAHEVLTDVPVEAGWVEA